MFKVPKGHPGRFSSRWKHWKIGLWMQELKASRRLLKAECERKGEGGEQTRQAVWDTRISEQVE